MKEIQEEEEERSREGGTKNQPFAKIDIDIDRRLGLRLNVVLTLLLTLLIWISKKTWNEWKTLYFSYPLLFCTYVCKV